MTRHLVILGAGYAGLRAAKHAARLLRGADVRLTLVNDWDHFGERVRLHQFATGQTPAARPLREVLAGTGIDLVTASVVGLDLDRRSIRLDSAPGELVYDTLIYALGSTGVPDSVPGAAEHAFGVSDFVQAPRLRARIAELGAEDAVAVVGGGLTAIEAATELAETCPAATVMLVSGSPVGGSLTEPARRHLRRAFDRLGIEVREGDRVTKVDADGLSLASGRRLPAGAVIWAGGFRVPELAAQAGLAIDDTGRLRVDERLRSVSHPEVYGIGDAAAAPVGATGATRMSCQTALPMGTFAAADIARQERGRPSRPFRMRYVGQNFSLGRRDGLVQFSRMDDTVINLVLGGRPAAWIKEAVVRIASWRATR